MMVDVNLPGSRGHADHASVLLLGFCTDRELEIVALNKAKATVNYRSLIIIIRRNQFAIGIRG